MAPAAGTTLDTDSIERAALDLVDEGGLDGLTMRALGRRLGVDPTAVYRYYRSKDDLLEALVDRVFTAPPRDRQQPQSPPEDAGWRDVARAGCQRMRRGLLAHAALVPLAVFRPPRSGGTLAGIEGFLGPLLGAGFDERETAAAYHALLYFTLGHAALEAPYVQMGDEKATAIIAETRGYYLAQPPEQYPHVAAVAPHLYGDLDEQFDYGLERLLDGLETALDGTRSDRSNA